MARLLLVDDEPDLLEIRTLVLRHAGHEVHPASSVREALRLFDESAFDVVVTDLRLPEPADGIELIHRLRERSTTVAILVLSGWPEDLRRQPEAGLVNSLLRKPVRSRELLELIERIA